MRITRYLFTTTIICVFSLLFYISISHAEEKKTAPRWVDFFYRTDSLQTVRSFELEDSPTIFFSESNLRSEEGDSLYNEYSVNLANRDLIGYKLNQLDEIKITTHLPEIRINLDKPLDEIQSKDYYLHGNMTVSFDDPSKNLGPIGLNIKGRGNSTWAWPKKPYRLKCDYKVNLLGIPVTKDFALLANYCDYTLLRNTVAYELGRMLGMPYNMDAVPVDVYLNDRYKGSYILTGKVGIGKQSVDIDERKGILWEFNSLGFPEYLCPTETYKINLYPKDPDISEAAAYNCMSPDEYIEMWRKDFYHMEREIKKGNPWEVVDLDDFAKYVLVQNLSCNFDFNHLNSVFAYKKDIKDKLHFGPLWDFDKGFDYAVMQPEHRYLIFHYNNGTFLPGEAFFTDLVTHPDFVAAFETLWKDFYDNKLPELLDFIDREAEKIKVSALRDGEIFPESSAYQGTHGISTETFDTNVAHLKKWIQEQADMISSDPSFMLIYELDLRGMTSQISE